MLYCKDIYAFTICMQDNVHAIVHVHCMCAAVNVHEYVFAMGGFKCKTVYRRKGINFGVGFIILV